MPRTAEALAELLRTSPMPDAELGANLGLYLERMHLSRILLMHELYRKTLNVAGVVVEFGVRWGQNMALFNAFRGMYEPYNYTRRVIGFDTFQGFPSVDRSDQAKSGKAIAPGDYAVPGKWRETLEDILGRHDHCRPCRTSRSGSWWSAMPRRLFRSIWRSIRS